MTDIERVIKGLEEVVHDFHEEVYEWGYLTLDELRGGITVDSDWFCGVLEKCEDAIAFLKKQEPRVLTMDEIKDYDDVLYMDIKDANNVFAVLYFGFNLYQMSFKSNHYSFYPEPNEYNSLFRCWTSRPTDEQRQNTPWSG